MNENESQVKKTRKTRVLKNPYDIMRRIPQVQKLLIDYKQLLLTTGEKPKLRDLIKRHHVAVGLSHAMLEGIEYRDIDGKYAEEIVRLLANENKKSYARRHALMEQTVNPAPATPTQLDLFEPAPLQPEQPKLQSVEEATVEAAVREEVSTETFDITKVSDSELCDEYGRRVSERMKKYLASLSEERE